MSEKHEPIQPGGKRRKYREVTLAAIVFGVVVGAIMNASITYSGLKIGFTIVGSSIAAVLGFGVLRGMLRSINPRAGSILETNIGQTIASSVNTTNSGVIFTVPVLLLLGYSLSPTESRFWLVTLACMAGAVLGTCFIIPLRKQMIDIDRLRFPSGTAVGSILKSPGAGIKKTIVLLVGIGVAMLVYLPTQLPLFHTEAALHDLDRLVENEKISEQDAQLTRTISGWIDQQSAPANVVEAGELRLAIRMLRAQIAEGGDKESREREIGSLETQIEALEEDSTSNAALTIAAARATAGNIDWSDLRSSRNGWAKDPFWGYSDLRIRMSREVDAEATAKAKAKDPDAREVLAERVDRDQSGRPDLLVTNDTIDVGRFLRIPDSALLMFAIAPFALGAGYLTGRAGLIVLAGGVLAYLFLNPILFEAGLLPETLKGFEVAEGWGRNNLGKPLGIGLLLGGAMMGIVVAFPSIRAALGSMAAAPPSKGGSDELGLKPLIFAAAGAFVLLFVAADVSTNDASNRVCPVTNQVLVAEVGAPVDAIEPPDGGFPTVRYRGYTLALADAAAVREWQGLDNQARDNALKEIKSSPGPLSGWNRHLRALVIAAIGTIWIWFAGIIIAQCTGMTDWSPISGIALLTVVLVMVLAGVGSVIPAVLVGATLCCAITMSADMMSDLRTGYIVGAQPRKQQIVELCTTWIGPVICMMVILLITQANLAKTGIPLGEGTETGAPQAEALKSVIIGVQGGDMPYMMYGLGTVLGLLLGLGSFAGLGVLVGLSMYLPFFYITTYGIGCVANISIAKWKGRAWAEEWGVPFAAGLIVGEAILSLIVNAMIVIMSSGAGS